jgi:hypothetical protein
MVSFTLQAAPLSWVFLAWYIVLFLEYETALHHLQMIVLPLLHFGLHYVAWLPGLIVFTNFKLVIDLCLLPSYYSSLEKKIAKYLNPYNSCFLKFISS